VSLTDADYALLAARLADLAEADPGAEVCGFIVADAAGRLAVVPVRNVAGEARGPLDLPREVRIAFLADPSAHLALSRRMRAEGGSIAAAFHSHVDAPAVLSAADVEQALSGGEPLHPGVDLLIIGMSGGKVSEIRTFRWCEGAFRGAAIPFRG